ncbi:MAG: phosphoenolpyruvate synthase [Gammaproteobacteria bacterium]|nr:phosphoenolpyruvate synthase [Gammaproteobacteria bacterium]
MEWVIGLEHLGMADVARVGGKNASLGEMIANLAGLGVSVPGGFATTADAFRAFLDHNGLTARIDAELRALDIEDVAALAATGARIRGAVEEAELPAGLNEAIIAAYAAMGTEPAVAVRSSATAEDLPDASFAGQQETYLNVRGIEAVLTSVKRVFASLYNDRAIAYRVHQGFAHHDVALSAGIQRMVRSDIGASGVMFTLDTESGFRDVVFITCAYGLGETVVQGEVNPDEFVVDKPNLAAGRPAVLKRELGGKAIKMIYAAAEGASVETVEVDAADRNRFSLSDAQVEELARMGVTIENHYGRPMDIEWGLDGDDGRLYILQARPETVESRADSATVERFNLDECGDVLAEGRAIGQRIGSGVAKVIEHASEMARVEPGDVLITDMTDPDWEPVMKRAAAIVTNRGGRTCHAAIIARELGIPAVVGCGDATAKLKDGAMVTVSCAQGDTGYVYAGQLRYSVQRGDVVDLPPLPTKVMMNVGNPGRAFQFSRIPNQGVGLARLEFIINNAIGIHPRALLEYERLDWELRSEIDLRIAGYADPVAFYVDKLVEGIATIAAGFRGKPVIVRMSDFKSNEYANLIGGAHFEPDEENPMIGFRGAGRYLSDEFRPCFELECRAIRRVREEMGFTEVEVMIPFVRTVEGARGVIEVLEANGLKRGEHGLRVIMMCEIPSNALLADEFLDHFDGFSIGSNDLTQLTLGLDRDSALVAHQFDERNGAVKALIGMAIKACRERGKYIGICGQGPSDFPDFAEWLLAQGIGSISLNPDTVVATWQRLAKVDA